MEQFFRGGTKFSEKMFPGIKIFSDRFHITINEFQLSKRNKIEVSPKRFARAGFNSVDSQSPAQLPEMMRSVVRYESLGWNEQNVLTLPSFRRYLCVSLLRFLSKFLFIIVSYVAS